MIFPISCFKDNIIAPPDNEADTLLQEPSTASLHFQYRPVGMLLKSVQLFWVCCGYLPSTVKQYNRNTFPLDRIIIVYSSSSQSSFIASYALELSELHKDYNR